MFNHHPLSNISEFHTFSGIIPIELIFISVLVHECRIFDGIYPSFSSIPPHHKKPSPVITTTIKARLLPGFDIYHSATGNHTV